MSSVTEHEDPEFVKQDQAWTAPKFFGLGFVTLVVAISIIYAFSARSGCSLQWVALP